MDQGGDIGWKQFVARLVDALRWPAAFVVVALIFREPLTRMIEALVGAAKG